MLESLKWDVHMYVLRYQLDNLRKLRKRCSHTFFVIKWSIAKQVIKLPAFFIYYLLLSNDMVFYELSAKCLIL